ncbi:Hypothetical Protein FCC1311_090462 [Hondaea fermentalgiana]|uniref:Uncharacterized protein n=1 Tax=Hondaea fermentalgiana TaxID=2315210 RepID=A0A2R5GWN5_9STRA|nr:Hypothetical Protein FCC1311_090462 [Hondaea fermentalgiana]|eukprot:GBG32821.1 Hypothetical Protein FCC1311_090462 [Hondaea fermentalgiana]
MKAEEDGEDVRVPLASGGEKAAATRTAPEENEQLEEKGQEETEAFVPTKDPFISDAKDEQATSDAARHAKVTRMALGAGSLVFALIIFFAAATTWNDDGLTSSSKQLIDSPNGAVPREEWDLYLQDRSTTLLGTDPKYKVLIHDRERIKRKRKRFDDLMEARAKFCGQFDRHLELTRNVESQEEPDETGWQLIKGSTSGRKFVLCKEPHRKCSTKLLLLHQVCHFPDPSREGVTVTIDRVGPFYMPGGYDWASGSWQDVGGLRRSHMGKTFSVMGGMFLPTFANGTAIGYPPLHIHHAHLFAYTARSELAKKTLHGYQSNSDLHHVLVQAHGDSECHASEGGLACLLDELADDEGHLLYDQQTGFSGDFDLNNVLNETLSGVYLDAVILHKDAIPARPVTYLHSGNGCLGTGPCTYDLPADPSHSVMWHRFRFPFSGTAREFHVHTHQTMADSVFVFRGKNAFLTLEPFRNQLALPSLIECNSQLGGSMDAAKKKVLTAVMEAENVELVCEMTKPSVIFDCNGYEETGECLAYDKRVALRCLDSIRVDKGDEIAVLAFNRAPPRRWISRDSPYFRKTLFGKDFALKQHSIFRMQFVHDAYNSADPVMQPPALYDYAAIPYFDPPGQKVMASSSLPAPPVSPLTLMKVAHAEITASCPPSLNISFAM